MAVNEPGISTLGVKFAYAVETTAGEKPIAFTWLERCNSISGITLDTEQIDASALEDYITRYVPGRQDTGGTWSVTFNASDEVIAQLEAMISDYDEGQDDGLNTWFEVWSPNLTEAFFVVAAPPKVLPMPEVGQNELQTMELTFVISEYKGMSEAIEPTEMASV